MRMKNLVIAMLCVMGCLTAMAQNPVSDALRERLTREAKVTVAAAEEMPADKYAYKPTEAQVPFGHWVSHATGANYFLCSKRSGGTAPEAGVKETDSKDTRIAAVKKSFDYCTTELAKLQDSQLKDEVTLCG